MLSAQLLQSMRVYAQLAGSLSQRIAITRDTCFVFVGVLLHETRVQPISFTLGSRDLRLPESAGLVFNFPFGKTTAGVCGSSGRLGRRGKSADFSRFAVSQEYISAALAIGWDVTAVYLFPMVELNGERRITAITAPLMTIALQAHVRAGGVSDHVTMHSFRVGESLSKSLAGTAVDEIIEIGGWKTGCVPQHYIGATTSDAVETAKGKRDEGSRRERDNSYAIAMDFPLSPAFQEVKSVIELNEIRRFHDF